MKALVVYFSRTNITKKLAEMIASQTGADLEEIIPKVNYNGKIGYARAGKDAMREKIIELNPLKYNPQDYDIVYLGVPVWAGKAANPMISYIKQNEGGFNNVKFFSTAGKGGFDETFSQLQRYLKKTPLKTLALTTKDVKNGEFDRKLADFLE